MVPMVLTGHSIAALLAVAVVAYNSVLDRYNDEVNVAIGNATPVYEEMDGQDLMTIAWDVYFDSLSFRFAYSRCKCNVPVPDMQPIMDILIANGQNAIADEFFLANDTSQFTNFGLKYNGGNWFVESEIAWTDNRGSIAGLRRGYYVSGGVYLGDLLVHLTAENEKRDPEYDKMVDPTPAALLPFTTGLAESTRINTNIFTIGVRYDFHSSAALKLEYQRANDKIADDEAELVSLSSFSF